MVILGIGIEHVFVKEHFLIHCIHFIIPNADFNFMIWTMARL